MKIKDVVQLAREQNGMNCEIYHLGKLIWSGDIRHYDKKYQNYNIKYTGFNETDKSTKLFI